MVFTVGHEPVPVWLQLHFVYSHSDILSSTSIVLVHSISLLNWHQPRSQGPPSRTRLNWRFSKLTNKLSKNSWNLQKFTAKVSTKLSNISRSRCFLPWIRFCKWSVNPPWAGIRILNKTFRINYFASQTFSKTELRQLQFISKAGRTFPVRKKGSIDGTRNFNRCTEHIANVTFFSLFYLVFCTEMLNLGVE